MDNKELQYFLSEDEIGLSRHNLRKSFRPNDLRNFSLKNGTQSGQHLSSLYDLLTEMCKEKKMSFFQPCVYVDYVPPRLTEGKVWYISYYVKNPATGKLKRFRIKVNRIESVKRRREVARMMMAALGEKLALGWSPYYSESAPRSSMSVGQAMESFLKVKEREVEIQSWRSYKSYIKKFQEWLNSHGIKESNPMFTLTKDTARAFLQDLELNTAVSARTYNNYLSFLVTLFDWMKERGFIQDNIFAGFHKKPKKLTAKKRRLLTTIELNRLFAWLASNNEDFLVVTLLCYCCFIRPKEIALLRCSDVDLERQVIHVRPEIAKNDNESFRTIPDAMMPVMRKRDLSKPDWFLFGKNRNRAEDFAPGPKPVSEKKFSDYWNRFVRPALGFGLDLQFYSLKDTGITNMIGDGVPINLVRQQADHSSVAMTAIYVGRKPSSDERIRQVEIIK